MSFFSRLFGKGKQEKQKELDLLPKQEELIEEDINYAEENEKRLQAGGISPEYFYGIFKENFPQYQIERTVSARRLDASCHEKCHPIDFLFSQNVQECIRYVVTGQYNKKNYHFKYEKMKQCGYRSLVNEFYKMKGVKRLSETANEK